MRKNRSKTELHEEQVGKEKKELQNKALEEKANGILKGIFDFVNPIQNKRFSASKTINLISLFFAIACIYRIHPSKYIFPK